MKGMILAAGLGTRLRPLTDHCPKALVPVLGWPAMDHVIRRLLEAGISHIAVNTHHMGEKIADYLEKYHSERVKIFVSHETQILGTGGGIGNIRSFLSEEAPFLVHNADVLSNVNLKDVIQHHVRSKVLVTMVLRYNPNRQTVWVSRDRDVLLLGEGSTCADKSLDGYDFTGISVMELAFIDFLPNGQPGSLVDGLRALLLRHPGSVKGYIAEHVVWRDLGNLSAYLGAHEDILVRRLPLISQDRIPETSLYVGEGSKVSSRVRLDGFVSIGRCCHIEDDVALENCIVWDGTVVGSGTSAKNTVFGPGWRVTYHPQGNVHGQV